MQAVKDIKSYIKSLIIILGVIAILANSYNTFMPSKAVKNAVQSKSKSQKTPTKQIFIQESSFEAIIPSFSILLGVLSYFIVDFKINIVSIIAYDFNITYPFSTYLETIFEHFIAKNAP